MKSLSFGLKKTVSFIMMLVLLFCVFNTASFSRSEVNALSGSGFSHFITRSGDKLMDGTRELRFISVNTPNLYWTGEGYQGPTPESAIEEQIKTVARMGGQVTRGFALPIKFHPEDVDGYSFNDPPKKFCVNGIGSYDEDCFRALDKALQLANEYGVRVIIPFINWYKWYGDIGDFAAMEPGKTYKDFYTDSIVKQNWKDVLSYVLNRTNYYTGVKYKDDKAILAWETANEANVDELVAMNDPVYKNKPHNDITGLTNADIDNWTIEMADYIKSIDPNHLVMDGRYGVSSAIVNGTNEIDIVTNHYYVGDYAARNDADRALTQNKKVFVVGEFGVYGDNTQYFAERLLDTVIDNGTSGAMIWSLYPHYWYGGILRQTSDFVLHWPGFPSGAVVKEKELLDIIRVRANEIQGNAVYDDLNDFSKVFTHSANLYFDNLNPTSFHNDPSRLVRSSVNNESVIYKAPSGKNFTGFELSTYFWPGEADTEFEVYTSPDNVTYSQYANPYAEEVAGNWKYKMYQGRMLPAGTNYIKIVISNPLTAWNPQIGRVALTYAEPIGVPDTPTMLPIISTDQIKWYGSYGSEKYDVERATSVSGPWTTVGTDILDSDHPYQPFHDMTAVDGTTYFYRVTGKNAAGSSTPSSPVQAQGGTANQLIDDLNDFSLVFDKSANMAIDHLNSGLMGNDLARGYRTDNNVGYLTYELDGDLASYRITSYRWPAGNGGIVVLTSQDGIDFEYSQYSWDVTEGTGGNWGKVVIHGNGFAVGTRYVKIILTKGIQNFDLEIGKVELKYGN